MNTNTHMRNGARMRHRKACALLLALLLLPAFGGQAVSFLGDDVVMNRRVERNTAKTLDFMPEVARARTDSLIIGVSDLLGEINPFWANTTGDNYVASLMADELVFASNDGSVGPGVATYTASLDGTTYSFSIRENVAYADGTPVTSDDFINALYLMLTPGYDGVYDMTRVGIVGVEDYLSGSADHISGISRVDDRSFHVSLKTANPSNLMHFGIPALRVSVFGDMRRPEGTQDADAFYQEALQGARAADASEAAYGQYLLEVLQPGEAATLTKNEGYWRGTPYIGTLQLLVVDAGDELRAIMEGEVDIVSMLGSVEAVDTVVDFETGFVNLFTWEGDVIGYLGMDLQDEKYADVSVRQALAIGFDRDAARRNRIERYGVTLDMILFDSFSVESKNMTKDAFAYDSQRADELLTGAGWVLEEDGIRRKDGEPFVISLTYNTPNPVMDTVVMQMRADYEKLGIEIQVETVPFDTLLQKIDAGECEVYFQARRLPSDAAIASDLFVGDSHLNESGYTSEMTERFEYMADTSSDAMRQTVLYELLYQEIATDMPIIPLYRRSEFLLVNARVMNVTVTTAHDITADAYRFFLTDTLEGQW